MSPAAQRLANILRQGADIRSLAARDVEHQLFGLPGLELEAEDFYVPWFALNGLTAPGQLVEGLAIALQRRIHRRDLRLRAKEARQHGLDLSLPGMDRPALEDLAFGIAGRSLYTEPHVGPIAFFGIEQESGKACRVAQQDGQQSAREGVERTRVTGLLGPVQALCRLQGVIGGDPDWFVEEEDAAYAPTHPLRGPCVRVCRIRQDRWCWC